MPPTDHTFFTDWVRRDAIRGETIDPAAPLADLDRWHTCRGPASAPPSSTGRGRSPPGQHDLPGCARRPRPMIMAPPATTAAPTTAAWIG